MKIGIFDSGYGGLTIMESIRKRLPDYDYVYLGDNARSPYGTRSFEVGYQYTLQCVKKLFEMDCQLIILACNTASAKALRTIQQKDLPLLAPNRRVLGVIRPTVEQVGRSSQSGYIGVLATEGTIQSQSYPLEIAKLFPQLHVVGQACPLWVPLIENREHQKPGADYFVRQYMDAIFATEPRIDTLILGCTHYPLLLNKIAQYAPKDVRIITQGEIVAQSLADYLQRHTELEQLCSKGGTISFYTTEWVEKFNSNASLFLNQPIEAQHITIE